MMTRIASKIGAAMLLLALVGAVALPAPSASAANENIDQFANINLPPDLGQSSYQVYFPETSHSLRGYFLDYWRANGGADVYGLPISEPFASENGLYSQAFENGVFQFQLELVWTDLPSVTLMPIGRQALASRQDSFRKDGRRNFGGGERKSSSWKAVNPAGTTATNAVNSGGVWSEVTGHTISGPMYDWYISHEGQYYLGEPISQPLRERGMTVQYFEGALMMMDKSGNVELAPLAREMADTFGIDTTPVDSSGMLVYNDFLFAAGSGQVQQADATTPGKRWIEISIDQQRLWAYQGSSLIATTLVSTGLDPNSTERGVFHVRYKLDKQDMAGTVNANGEVVALGQDAADSANAGQAANEAAYEVKDVPNVMYFNYDAEALHGAYWHNNFGYKMSHGCVNLPLDFASFLYQWAPLGTMVWVH